MKQERALLVFAHHTLATWYSMTNHLATVAVLSFSPLAPQARFEWLCDEAVQQYRFTNDAIPAEDREFLRRYDRADIAAVIAPQIEFYALNDEPLDIERLINQALRA